MLVLLHDFSYLRNFAASLRMLRRKGYRIVLALPETAERGSDADRSIVRRNVFELLYVPVRRDDAWAELTNWLRPARMYAHFLQARYAAADYLRQRAAGWTLEAVRSFVDDPLFRDRQTLLRRLLSAAETAVPAWTEATRVLEAVAPDAILVSPLLFPNTYYQNDYVKAAHALGLPVALPVFSWDNLTNKGPIQVLPDHLFVWNETQREEAVELHGMPARAVTSTGGMRFDQFFDEAPRSDRRSFHAALGLDPERPLLTYLGSSRTIAPEEHLFVRRWLLALRGSQDPRLAGCNVLIRPHPSNCEIWQSADFAGLGPVAFSSMDVSNVDGVIDAVLHSVAVVGINTTAMLEAGALERPLFTITDPAVRDGQAGTLHFHYLTEVAGGLVSTAADFDAHLRQLGAVLDGDQSYVGKSRHFSDAFLRPPERTRPSVEVFVEAVERFVRDGRKRVRTPLWAPLVRAGLRAALPRLKPSLIGEWRRRHARAPGG